MMDEVNFNFTEKKPSEVLQQRPASLIICHGVESSPNIANATLRGVINSIVGLKHEATPLRAVVGAVVAPDMKGKALDMIVWRLDRNGERKTLPGYVGTPLILPEALGPQLMPFAFDLPTPTRGVYGADLFDRLGAFGVETNWPFNNRTK